MGNDFTFIGKDNLTPEDVAYRLGRLSEDLRDVIASEDAKRQVREVLQDPTTAQVLGPERVQGMWTDVRKLEGVGDIRDYLMNVSRFVEKEGRAKESWSNMAQYLGKADAATQTENNDDDLYFELLYPEKRTVSATQILSWARDAEANGKIEGGFEGDVFAAAEQLEDAGLITRGNKGNPVSEDSEREASAKEMIARLVVLAQDAVSATTKSSAVLKAVKFFNEPSLKAAFGQSRINWIHQDMRNAGDTEGVVQVIRSLIAQLEKEGLPAPTESVIAAMVPAGGARTMGWGESFEVGRGMYKGLKGIVKKYGRFVEAEVQETWRGKLNGLPVEIMEGSLVNIPARDLVEEVPVGMITMEAVAASEVEIDWREAEETINNYLTAQTKTLFSLPDFIEVAKKKLAEYNLGLQDFESKAPAGQESLKITYGDKSAIEDTYLDIRWMTKDGETHIDSAVHFPEAANAEKEEELDSEIYLKLEDKIESMANASAAQAWSTPNDEQIDKHGEVWIKAEFGDWVAINGDLVIDEKTNMNPPEGFEKTNEGGRIPTVEEEVSLEHAIDSVAKDMKLDFDRVERVAKKENKKNEVYTSVSGDAEIWAKPKTDEEGRVLAPKLDAKVRKAINDQLYDFNKQYWKSIPLSDIRGILNSNGLDFEDSIITGRDGRDTFDLTMGGHPVSNSVLVLSWHKMESGNWEINSYLS
jgi:hypothetical protein